jgi:hypothetical protein
MNTTRTAIPNNTTVTVHIDFEPSETGTIVDHELVSGEISYLVNLTSGYQEWFAAADVTADVTAN